VDFDREETNMAYDKITGEWINPIADLNIPPSPPFGGMGDIQGDYGTSPFTQPLNQPPIEPPQEEYSGVLAQTPPPVPAGRWNPKTMFNPDTGRQEAIGDTPISITGVGNRMMIQDSRMPQRPAIDEYGNPVSRETQDIIQSNIGEAPISEEDRKYLGVREPSEMDMKLTDFAATLKQQGVPDDKIKGAVAMAANELMKAEIASKKDKDNIIPITGNLPAGDAAIEDLPSGQQSVVKKIANYEIPLPSGMALRTPYWQSILERTAAYDPSFDVKEYKKRQDVMKDFTAGKSYNNIRSLNTAIAHLGNLAKAGEELKNSSVTPWNWIANKSIAASGDPRVKKYMNAATAVEGELATVFKGTAGTDQEIKQWRENLSMADSPEQIQTSVDELISLLGGRLNALRSGYQNGMGRQADYSFVSDKSAKILQGLGIDPQSLEKNGVAQVSTPSKAQKSPLKNNKGGVLQIDAKGNKAYVYPDGTFEEVQ
jgi:hypothetical protein